MPPAWQGFLCLWILGHSVTPGVGVDVVVSHVILGVSEHLGFGLPLGVVGVGAESAPKVCSRCGSNWKEPVPMTGKGSCIPGSWGVPVTLGVGVVVVASLPVILGVLEHLGVELPLGVVGLGVEPAPKVCSGH